MEAFRALIKIGFHFLPDSELPNFELTADWLALEEASPLPSSNIIETTFPDKRLEGIHVALFRRRKMEDLPYMGMTITFYNYTFCTYFPLCKADQHLGSKSITTYDIPNPIHLKNPVMKKCIDLSINKPISEDQELRLSFDSDQEKEMTDFLDFLENRKA